MPPSPKNSPPVFYPRSREEWRQWLEQNHAKASSVQLLQYKKSAGKPTISWNDAVDEALCFGWIDSTRRSLPDDRFLQYFSKRKPNGNWSRINKDKLEKLADEGRITQAGWECITNAQLNGSWNQLDAVEDMIMPDDLAKGLQADSAAFEYFDSRSNSIKKRLLHWVMSAKRPETRKARIIAIVAKGKKGELPI